jgi:hypothetical protein
VAIPTPTPPAALSSSLRLTARLVAIGLAVRGMIVEALPSLESLTEWILTQMSQDLVQVRKPSFSAEARLRADNWCTERFELWH